MAFSAVALLPETTITTATTITGDAYALGPIEANALIVEAIFTYGSGGTSVKAWIQTSLDGGTTWVDVISLPFLLATASKVSSISTAIAPSSQAFTPSDGALADGTVIQGVLGDRVRCKVITLGTYAANTRIACWVSIKGSRR